MLESEREHHDSMGGACRRNRPFILHGDGDAQAVRSAEHDAYGSGPVLIYEGG